MTAHVVEGYAVRRALGAGRTGSAWLARDLGSGRTVVLKRVPAASIPAAGAFRRDLALARGLGHPHVVRLLDIRQTASEWILVSEYAVAGSLADLLERRGPLTTGELVTLVVPVAQALTAAHAAGLTHGDLDARDVVFTADGRPLVAGLGLRSVGRASAPPTPAADLAALAALVSVAGGDDGASSADLFQGEAAAVAPRWLSLATPEPIDLGFGPAARPPTRRAAARRPATAARREPRRRSDGARPRTGERLVRRIGGVRLRAGVPLRAWPVPAILASVIAFAAAGLGLAEVSVGGRPGRAAAVDPGPPGSHPAATLSARPAPSSPSAAPVDRWTGALRQLDVRRAAAFAAVSERALDTVYVRGSPPWRADRAVLAAYRDRGLRVVGLRLTIHRVSLAEAGEPDRRRGMEGGQRANRDPRVGAGPRPPNRAPVTVREQVLLRVEDHLTGGVVVDRAGRRTALPLGPPTVKLISLTRVDGQWRISRIVAV